MGRIPIIWEYVAHQILTASSISLQDWVNITAQFWSLLNNEKDQESVLKARGYTEEQLKEVTKDKPLQVNQIAGLKFTVPTTRFSYDYFQYVLKLLENYERGNLPYPGTISEQPAQIIEILTLLQNIRIEYQKRLTPPQAPKNVGHNQDKSRTRRQRRK